MAPSGHGSLLRAAAGHGIGDKSKIVASDNLNWTSEQASIIEAPPAARLIVDAGPGTGKTATLCARIAWLIDSAGLEPGAIWIISFTRTAVAEIRSRVSSYLSDPAAAHGIRVATIDSHAWAMNVGFTEEPVLSGNFDDNIEHVIEVIKSNENATEYISSVRHLFIDEAQDVVGPRIEFVLELIHAMPSTSGVTVLCDEAQAIYDVSEDDAHDQLSGTLVDNIKEFMPEFRGTELTEIHRTGDALLKDLFVRGRRAIKNEYLRGRAKYQEVRRTVVECSHDRVGDAVDDLQCIDCEEQDVFLLFRRRGEALSASKRMGSGHHRLRMSGFPAVIDDWVGLVFWDWVEARISKGEFQDRWSGRVPMGGLSKDAAWDRLIRLAGKSESVVDVHKLRRRLASLSPPLEVCRAEFGSRGPVVGTIHAAKGREAREVRLYLPRPESMRSETEDSFEDESKILFVGATRSKERLLIGKSFMSYSSRLPRSGRAYTRCANPPWAAEVEIGRVGDITAEGLAGRQLFAAPDQVRRAQARIAGLRYGIHRASARSSEQLDYIYQVALEAAPNEPILGLHGSVNRDLFQIARNLRRRRPPRQLGDLRTLGVRTVAIAPDDPGCTALHSPWSESGFLLAPLLLGYGVLAFR